MKLGIRPRIGLAAFLLAGALTAQQERMDSRFEVISIKAVPPNSPPFHFDANYKVVLPGGHYRNDIASLTSLIAFANNEKLASRVVGLPDWAEKARYIIDAKATPGGPALSPVENHEQVRLMIRAMLTDRFNLQVHKEARQERLYNLELASDGFKFKPVDPPEVEGRVSAAMGNYGGRVIAKKGTLRDLANALAIFLGRAVTDRTGLQGYYDFDVGWSAPETDEPIATGFGAQAETLLMTTLRERFGLRLTTATGPVGYVVVDHVEPPSQN